MSVFFCQRHIGNPVRPAWLTVMLKPHSISLFSRKPGQKTRVLDHVFDKFVWVCDQLKSSRRSCWSWILVTYFFLRSCLFCDLVHVLYPFSHVIGGEFWHQSGIRHISACHGYTALPRWNVSVSALSLSQLAPQYHEQEAQLMLTTGSTRLAVSRGQQIWYHSTCNI